MKILSLGENEKIYKIKDDILKTWEKHVPTRMNPIKNTGNTLVGETKQTNMRKEWKIIE